VLIHKSSEETSEAREGTQLLQRGIDVITDKASHDRCRTLSVLATKVGKGVTRNYSPTLHPPEEAIDQSRTMIDHVQRPLQAPLLEPLLHG
jgi:hypothetical protein